MKPKLAYVVPVAKCQPAPSTQTMLPCTPLLCHNDPFISSDKRQNHGLFGQNGTVCIVRCAAVSSTAAGEKRAVVDLANTSWPKASASSLSVKDTGQ